MIDPKSLRGQLEKIFKDKFHESWMNEEDWNEFEKELFTVTNTSYEKMIEEIEIGVKNGVPAEKQLQLFKMIF